MAKKVDTRLQEIVYFLPATGEVLYDDWKKSIIDAGRYAELQLTRTAKSAGLAVYRLQDNDDGSQSLFVSRAATTPPGAK